MGFFNDLKAAEGDCTEYRKEAIRILLGSGDPRLKEYADFIMRNDSRSPSYYFNNARRELQLHSYAEGERLLAEHGSPYIRALTAYNTGNRELLIRFSQDKEDFVRLCTLKNRRMSGRQDLHEFVSRMVRDESDEVRNEAIANIAKVSNIGALRRLAWHRDATVAEAVQSRLERLEKKGSGYAKTC